jgi:D-tyrosyl-tRNA(Tyr) deacylase
LSAISHSASDARVRYGVQGKLEGEIGMGLLVLIGISARDSSADADYLAEKLVNLRVFSDSEGRMNRSALDVNAELLLISRSLPFTEIAGRAADPASMPPLRRNRRVSCMSMSSPEDP